MFALRRTFLICVALATLSGCENPYAEFYKSTRAPGVTIAAEPSAIEPRIVSSSGDLQRDVQRMFEDGYAVIGVASFVGPAQHESAAVSQAKKVGAAIVIIANQYRNTETGAMPLTLPTATTSYSTGTVSAYGTGGSAFGNYSGSTTTYGTQTTYIPYSVDKYNQEALFFAPLDRRGLGIMFDRLSDGRRRQIGTNQGEQITAVRKGSPAFVADILPGDVLLSIDGQSVYDQPSMQSALSAATGHEVELHLMRGAAPIIKKVTIPVDGW